MAALRANVLTTTRACTPPAFIPRSLPPGGVFARSSASSTSAGVKIRPLPELWGELLPFLLMDGERVAERALEEYLRYRVDPGRVDLQWLGLRVNEAMARVDLWNDQIADLVEDPARAFAAPWMALLSYESLLRLRRAVALYGSDRGRALRHSFWHGLPLPEDPVQRSGHGRAPFGAFRPGGRLVPARLRRLKAAIPTALS